MKDEGLGMAWQIEVFYYNMKIKRIEFFQNREKNTCITHVLTKTFVSSTQLS